MKFIEVQVPRDVDCRVIHHDEEVIRVIHVAEAPSPAAEPEKPKEAATTPAPAKPHPIRDRIIAAFQALLGAVDVALQSAGDPFTGS